MIRRMKMKKRRKKKNVKRKVDDDDQALTQGIGQIWVKWVRSSSSSPTLSATWNTFACKKISIIIITIMMRTRLIIIITFVISPIPSGS